MDAFYSAIEERDNPDLRGKPVIIGADPKGGKGRGVVSTANYKAREFGVHSAMPISQAYKLCPDGIYLKPDMKKYSRVSAETMKIFAQFSNRLEQVSVDEAYLDCSLTTSWNTVEKFAKDIQKRVKEQVHLTCSIGAAGGKHLAKIASDLKKPAGLVIVPPGHEKEFLAPLTVSRLQGVGKKTGEKLAQLNINLIGELARQDEKEMIRLLGKTGGYLWRLSQGLDESSISTSRERKSLSIERTFEQDIPAAAVAAKINALCEELLRLMKKEKLHGKTLQMKIRTADFTTITRSVTRKSLWNDSDVKVTAEKLFSENTSPQKKIRLLGLSFSNFHSQDQLDLFHRN